MTGPLGFSHYSGPDGKTNFGYGLQVRTVRTTTKGPKLAEQGFISSGDEQGGEQFVQEVAAAAAVAAEGAARSARNYWIFSEFSFRDCEAELTVLQRARREARRAVRRRIQTSLRRLEARRIANRK